MSVEYPSSCDASGKSIKVENPTSGENSYFTGHKVGIGTTSPQAELHTKGGSGSGDGTEHTGLVLQGTSYGMSAGSQLQFDLGDGSEGCGYGAAIAAVDEYNFDTRLDFRTKNSTSHSNTFCIASDTKMSIDADGNVGIGTTSPQNKLSVAGTASVDGNVGIGTSNKLSKLTIVGSGSYNITGSVAKTSGYNTLIGTNTKFLTEVGIGDRILVPGGANEYKIVTAITDDEQLSVDSNWENTRSGEPAVIYPSIFRVEDHTNALQMIIKYDGTARIKSTTDSTTAVEVQKLDGTTVLDVDTTNSRVGIGTTSPSNTLDVAGTARIKTTTNSTTAVQVQASGGGTVLDVDTTNSRVGIGTTSPASVVEIKGPRGTGNTGQLLVTSDVDEPAYIQVRATDINDPCGIQFIGNESTSNPEWTIQVPSGGGGTSDNLQFIGKGGSWITFKSEGNVGIGEESPASLLEISAQFANPVLTISNKSPTAAYDPSIAFRSSFGGTPITKFTIGVDDSEDDKLKIGTSSVDTNTRVTIDSSGLVGIGTTSPAAQLTVSGGSPDTTNGIGQFLNTLSEEESNFLLVGKSASDGEGARFGYRYVPYGNCEFAFMGVKGDSFDNSFLVRKGGNVGIGWGWPNSKLAVTGGVTIGSDWGQYTAPEYGMIVEGKVGIGTTSPTQALQVGRADTGDGTSDGQLVLGKTDGTADRRLFKIGLDANYNLSIGDYGYTGSETYTPIITMTWDGAAVGIGTSAPAAGTKLDVNGNIKTSGNIEIDGNLNHVGSNVGFFNTTPTGQITVSGSRGGNAALANLLTALANYGLIVNNTSA